MQLGRPRTRRILWIAAGVLSLVAVLGFLVAPPLLRGVVEQQASAALGRVVTLERLQLNPFALSAALDGLRIADADGKGRFVEVARVEANLELWASLFHRGPVLRSLRVVSPQLYFARLDAHRFSFSDILDRFAAQPKPTDAEPLRFAINNIQLDGGHIEFDDQPEHFHHVVDTLRIGLPFVSTVPSQVHLEVEPRLSATINGTEFELSGKMRPFAAHREATLALDLDAFDVTPYLAYVPAKLPLKIEQALLATHLECVWSEQASGQKSLSLRGEVSIHDARFKDRAGAPLASWKSLQIGLQDLRPLATPQQLRFSQITLSEPTLRLRRLPDGSIDLARLFGTDDASPLAANASAPAAASSKASAPHIAVAQLQISKGRVSWQDDALPTRFSSQFSPIDLKLSAYDSGASTPATLQGSVQLERSGRVQLDGTLDAQRSAARLRVQLADLQIAAYRPYYQDALGSAQPRGQVAASLNLDYAPASGLQLSEGALQLSEFSLPEAGNKQPIVQLASLKLDGLKLDLAKRSLALAQISSRDAQWRLVRDADGINLLRQFSHPQTTAVNAPPAVAAVAAAPAAPAGTAPPPWQLSLGKLDIAGWRASLEDRSAAEPLRLNLDALQLRVQNLSNATNQKAQLALEMGVNRRGRLKLAGDVGLAPLSGKLQLDASGVELLFAQPYLSNLTKVLLTQGALDAKGTLGFDLSAPQAPQVSWTGDLAVKDFNSFDQLNASDFVRWKRLALSQLKLRSQPLELSAAQLRLEDFYTRLILDGQGRLNLRELVQSGARREGADLAAASSSAASAVPAAAGPAPKINIERIVLSGGSVSYSDRFIKPNYNANLTDLAGSLNGLSSSEDSVASLALKAALDHSAPVDIQGQLNPLRQDRIMDIHARVADVDLTGVSTYAARYVGYGISKGKLSMDVDYRIRDRQLSAENRVTLDQLTFGERIDSPDATRLPVLLAVALLKDRSGVIDLNLPISGTLDDPEFSVGSVIVRVLVNLVSKAVSSPFALLGSLVEGGDELSYLDFESGRASVSPAGITKLAALAKALNARPALSVDITGSADPQRDADGIRRERLDSKLRAAKAANMVKRGDSVGEVDALRISREEYPLLLEQVFKQEKFDKPRNVLGITRSLPTEQMETLMLSNIPVSMEDLQALASRRAALVRDWLVGEGKVALARVFVVGSSPNSAESAAARVIFSLK
ncbi:hypothetical protein GCM10028811_33620 [Uliginosibacterium sediminicola]